MEEEFELVEDRIISGRGILQIPQEKIWRYFRIFIDVFRLPEPDYRNGRWNPDRGEFAKMLWLWDDYVWKEDVIRFEKEVYDYYKDLEVAYLTNMLACSFASVDGLLRFIVAQLGGIATTTGTLFATPILRELSQLNFVVRDGAAIQVRLYGIKYDEDCPGAEDSGKVQEPPTSGFPPVPNGTPVEVSAPYVAPDDNGDTVPGPGDTVEPNPGNPQGDECVGYLLEFFITTTNNPTGFPGTSSCYGVYDPDTLMVDSQNPNTATMDCQGRATDGGNPLPCLGFGTYIVFSTGLFPMTSIQLVNVTPL